MTNLDVAVGSFWQLARHWNQGGKAKLELSCEDGNLHMQLSAVLGHPDQPHFPHPPPHHHPPPPPSFPPARKRKSPSQLRRQERRKQEALAKAEEADLQEESEIGLIESADTENVVEAESENPAEMLVGNTAKDSGPKFKCDQCDYTNATEWGLSQHTRMKHRISQVDGNIDIEDEDSEEVDVDTLELDEVSRSKSKKEQLCCLCQEECGNCLDGTCEECEYKATEEGLTYHIMNDHEPQDVLKHFGLDWVNDNWKGISRNLEYAQDRYHLQKWENVKMSNCRTPSWNETK